jgi:hypothetical protein
MPDLKSELKKLEALKFDDEGEPDMPITMKPKSERESVWEYIKANPMSSSAGVSAALGIDASSSASQVGALLNKSLLTRVHIGGSYHYTAVGDSYPVFDRVAHGKKIGRATRGKPKKSRVVKDERPKAQAPAPIPLAAFSAQDMIESMPVGKARALYDELKKLFGV